MRFLVDECCPRAFVDALRLSGHDVLYAAEMARSASDEELAAMAAGEDRLVVTQDYDFGELAVRRKLAVSGVVLIACQGQPRLIGALAVIEPKRVRLRDLRAET